MYGTYKKNRNKQKKIIFWLHLESHWQEEQDVDSVLGICTGVIADPDPHWFGSLIQIRIEIKSWIQWNNNESTTLALTMTS